MEVKPHGWLHVSPEPGCCSLAKAAARQDWKAVLEPGYETGPQPLLSGSVPVVPRFPIRTGGVVVV